MGWPHLTRLDLGQLGLRSAVPKKVITKKKNYFKCPLIIYALNNVLFKFSFYIYNAKIRVRIKSTI